MGARSAAAGDPGDRVPGGDRTDRGRVQPVVGTTRRPAGRRLPATRLRLLYAAPVAAAGLAADQLAKLAVRAGLPACDEFPIVDCARAHLGPITLVRVHNSGTGYLFLRSPVVAIGLGLAGCLLVAAYAAWLHRMTPAAVVGVGLQAAGALSNLLDRLLAGGVTDYVNLTPRFTFNLADVMLLAGMVLAVASIARGLARPATA